jgi:hypothetical protein
MESYKEEKIVSWSRKMRFSNHLDEYHMPQMNSEKVFSGLLGAEVTLAIDGKKCTLIQNFSKMLQIPNMQTLVKIVPSFNIVSPSLEFLHQPLIFFTKLSILFHQASTFFSPSFDIFFTKVQLNIFFAISNAW